MSKEITDSLLKRHDLAIGSFYFHQHHMVAEIKEGVTCTYEQAKDMLALGKKYYGNTKPFVYISNRKNSYSFDPTSHFKTMSMFPNLKGYGVVVYDRIKLDIAKMANH